MNRPDCKEQEEAKEDRRREYEFRDKTIFKERIISTNGVEKNIGLYLYLYLYLHLSRATTM